MGKTVGVISNYDITNYGNRLQNYAVCRIFEKMGYESMTLVKSDIKYQPYKLMGKRAKLRYLFYSFFNKEKCRIMKKQVGYANRLNHFYDFEKRFAHMDIRSDSTRWKKLDYYALGSDQVLHPFYVEKMEELSLKNLSGDRQRRSIMVAPSFGVTEIEQSQYPTYAAFLKNIGVLSVREKEGAKLIQRICGRKAQVVVDPTMLLTADEWRAVSKPMPAKKKPYILKFFLGEESPEVTAAIDVFAKEKGYEVRKLLDQEDVDTFFAGPSEFLWLIDCAEYVCTDSFHGSVFSVLFHKKFFVFPRSGIGKTMGSRIDTLLQTFELGKQYVENRIDWSEEPDYTRVDTTLEAKRAEFQEYLEDAMKGNKG